MIKFFRKIRRALINTGSTRKYLLYAVGEITLVVIGILIALQINNHNEWKKERKLEQQIILELKENLELNISHLENEINRKNRSDFSSKVILNAIENNLMYHDSLEKHFGWGLSFENTSPLSNVGYKSYRDAGTNILTNNALKKEIIYLFEDTYNNSNTRLSRLSELNVETVKLRQKHLLRKRNFRFEPFDYPSLKEDNEFVSWARSIKESRNWGKAAMQSSLEETERVLQLINQELE